MRSNKKVSKTTTKPSVNIVMVTWNALDYTKFALESLFRYTNYPYLLTIVDNGSNDGTLEYLSEIKNRKTPRLKKMKIVCNKENIGYGGATEKGYKQFSADYSCLVNNDVVFSKNWLTNMMNTILNNPSVAMLGPLRPAPFCKHPYTRNNTDLVIESLDDQLDIQSELNAYCKRRKYDDFVRDVLKTNNFGLRIIKGPPMHIVTCCALLNNSVVSEVGGMAEERFYFGCDDSDLSWRISTSGYDLGLTSNAYVHHFKHKSVKQNKQDLKRICHNNSEHFYNKWKKHIDLFIKSEIKKGVKVDDHMSSEKYYEYWLLRRINDKVHFWKEQI